MMNKETVALLENSEFNFSSKFIDIEYNKILKTVVLDISELVEVTASLLFENSHLKLTFLETYHPFLNKVKNKQNIFALNLIKEMIIDQINFRSSWVDTKIQARSIFYNHEFYRMLAQATNEFNRIITLSGYSIDELFKASENDYVDIITNSTLEVILDNIDQVMNLWLMSTIDKLIGKDVWHIYSLDLPLASYDSYVAAVANGLNCDEPEPKQFKLYLHKHQDYRSLSWMNQNSEGEENETNLHDTVKEH